MAFLRMCLAVIATLCVSNLRSSEACSCLRGEPILLQDLFCQSEYVIEVTVVRNEIITEATPGNPFSPTSIRKRRFTVNTSNVYKTSPNYEAIENKNFIFTGPHSAACGVNLENDVKYVIFGEVGTREQISINLCGFRGFRLDRLNADQLCGLQYAYKDNCDKCKIDYCREMGGCGQQTVSQQSCVFDQVDAAFRCFNQHAVCKALSTRRGRQCHWDDLGMGKLDSCLDNLPEEA